MNNQLSETVSRRCRRLGGMRTWAVALSATFFCAALGRNFWGWIGPPSWKPRIECNAATFDFGERHVGDLVEHEFVVTNTGWQDLVITNVATTCHCVAVQLGESKAPPGSSLRILAQVSLDPGPSRSMKKGIIVESNDPDVPRMVLAVAGRVVE